MNIVPIAGCPLGTSGKILPSTGLSSLANAATRPPFSPIFIIPIQKQIFPAILIINVVVELIDSNKELFIENDNETKRKIELLKKMIDS
jgi:hypothetical protein